MLPKEIEELWLTQGVKLSNWLPCSPMIPLCQLSILNACFCIFSGISTGNCEGGFKHLLQRR